MALDLFRNHPQVAEKKQIAEITQIKVLVLLFAVRCSLFVQFVRLIHLVGRWFVVDLGCALCLPLLVSLGACAETIRVALLHCIRGQGFREFRELTASLFLSSQLLFCHLCTEALNNELAARKEEADRCLRPRLWDTQRWVER